MNRTKIALLSVVVTALGLVALACGADDRVPGPATGSTATLPPTVNQIVDAPIDSAEVLIRESDPPSYALEIRSGLPNSCYRFNEYTVTRNDDRVLIRVTNVQATGSNIACAQLYGTVQNTVELPGGYDAGKTFTVDVNGRVLTFVGQTRAPSGTVGSGIISGRDALLLGLRSAGVDVERGGEVVQPFFKPAGEIMRILGEDVQVFEFPTVADAEAAAGGVSPGGSTIASTDGSVSSVLWVAPPHFYRVDNVISLYVGTSEAVTTILDERAGEKFAGPGVAVPSEEPADEPVASARAMAPEPAPIESVEMRASETEPTRYFLHVEYGLRNGCIEPGDYRVLTSFPPQIVVNALAPADKGVICTEQYRVAAHDIDLGGGFWPCLVYTIPVNSRPYDVQAVAPNVRCESSARAPVGFAGYDSLLLSLRSGGADVQEGDEVRQMFFERPGRLLEIDGEKLQVFDFPGAAAARKAAGRVDANGYNVRLPSQPDGREAVVHGDWISTPHFFQHATVIVIYVGDNRDVLGLLEARMGAQFAGGPRMAHDSPAPEATPRVDLQRVPAIIEAVDIFAAESTQPRPLYVVNLTVGLPNSCYRFGEATVARDGDRVRVEVASLKNADPDVLCAQVYSTIAERVLLGADFEPGVTYTVEINGLARTFVAR